MDTPDNDVRIKETTSLSSSVSSEKSRYLASQKQEASKNRNSLLRSQSVSSPKITNLSGSRSPLLLSKQTSLSAAPGVEPWKASSPTEPASSPVEGERSPVLTLASSFTDKSNVTFGFDLPKEGKD